MDAAELVILRGDKRILQLRLDRAEVCIGSNPTNDVVLPDDAVPQVAALLVDRGAHRYWLRTLADGLIRLNGEALPEQERELNAGDSLEIGPYTLILQQRDGDRPEGHGHTSVAGTQVHSAQSQAQLRAGGKAYVLSAGAPFNIGTHEDNDLRIEDAFASSFHCRIAFNNNAWFLSDLESTNGTKVNGLKVREAELPVPATIQVGGAVLKFEGPVESPRAEANADAPFHGMTGRSPSMQRVFRLVRRLAPAREPVLVNGESGCGKELVARALHDASSRTQAPYLALNCGALTHSLIESELFGHVKGAFTGATHDKPGAFEAASRGTLFLDEIGELPLDLQPKLLRVLESSTVRRVGGTKEIPVTTRIVAATHRNLEALVQEGKFREDLFHRLFVLSISIPALAERPEDILPLAQRFMAGAERKMSLDASAEAALIDYTWPGNIRELKNVLVRAMLMTDEDVISAHDLQFSRDAFTTRSKDVRRSVRQHDEQERTQILDALDKTNGNRSEAARMLGVSKSTFHDRIKRYGVPPKYGQKS